jgi:hypothetical protein
MPEFVRTEKDEKLWEKAKEIVKKQYGKTEADGDEFWALVTGVYKRAGGRVGGDSVRKSVSGARLIPLSELEIVNPEYPLMKSASKKPAAKKTSSKASTKAASKEVQSSEDLPPGGVWRTIRGHKVYIVDGKIVGGSVQPWMKDQQESATSASAPASPAADGKPVKYTVTGLSGKEFERTSHRSYTHAVVGYDKKTGERWAISFHDGLHNAQKKAASIYHLDPKAHRIEIHPVMPKPKKGETMPEAKPVMTMVPKSPEERTERRRMSALGRTLQQFKQQKEAEAKAANASKAKAEKEKPASEAKKPAANGEKPADKSAKPRDTSQGYMQLEDSDGDMVQWQPAKSAQRVEIHPDLHTFLHRGKYGWLVINHDTGLAITSGKTRAEAINNAKQRVRMQGPQQIQENHQSVLREMAKRHGPIPPNPSTIKKSIALYIDLRKERR